MSNYPNPDTKNESLLYILKNCPEAIKLIKFKDIMRASFAPDAKTILFLTNTTFVVSHKDNKDICETIDVSDVAYFTLVSGDAIEYLQLLKSGMGYMHGGVIELNSDIKMDHNNMCRSQWNNRNISIINYEGIGQVVIDNPATGLKHINGELRIDWTYDDISDIVDAKGHLRLFAPYKGWTVYLGDIKTSAIGTGKSGYINLSHDIECTSTDIVYYVREHVIDNNASKKYYSFMIPSYVFRDAVNSAERFKKEREDAGISVN